VLYPTQPSSVRRLVAYGAVVVAACVLPVAIELAQRTCHTYRAVEERRRWVAVALQRNPSFAASCRAAYPGMAAAQIIDAEQPPMSMSAYLGDALKYGNVRGLLVGEIAAILWPAATAAALLIFQASMRRARVRGVHALRCVVYSCDLLLVANAMPLAVLCWIVLRRSTGDPSFARDVDWYARLLPWLAAAAAPMFLYRLWTAVRLYLRLPHAPAVIITTQAIALLVLGIVLSNLYWLRGP
jgi:hypothetical protein